MAGLKQKEPWVGSPGFDGQQQAPGAHSPSTSFPYKQAPPLPASSDQVLRDSPKQVSEKNFRPCNF